MRLTSRVTPGRVTGPYESQGRRYVTVEHGGRKRNMTYARWLMQEQLGRQLTEDEHVHHIDGDALNDTVSNYRVIARSDHGREHSGATEMVTFTCPMCGITTTKEARFVRHNRRQGKLGPFCGRVCAGRFNASARTPTR